MLKVREWTGLGVQVLGLVCFREPTFCVTNATQDVRTAEFKKIIANHYRAEPVMLMMLAKTIEMQIR